MNFDAKEKILRLSAEELVLLAAAHYGNQTEGALPSRLPPKKEDGEACSVTCAFALPAFAGEMRASAFRRVSAEGVCTITCRFALPRLSAEENVQTQKLLRALGYAYAYAFAKETPVAFRFYLESEQGELTVLEEAPEAKKLESFFARMLMGLVVDAEHEIERVTVRMPSFLSVPFPYPDVREGQKDMMGAVYAAAKQGETLFAVAPTGTGKTMAALFPAIRALGHGHVQKIFYLTPKNTSARAACEATELLFAHGMRLRALHLVAKERICAGRASKGDCTGCTKKRRTKDALSHALEELLSRALPVVGEHTLSLMAEAHGVCPYMLALAYSRFADIVIGDYNYLFDPFASPPSLFQPEQSRVFLIDEAHNLPDRAREMYSGGVDTDFFAHALSLYDASGEAHDALLRLSRGFLKTVDLLLEEDIRIAEDGKTYGFAKASNFPESYRLLAEKTVYVLRKERNKSTADDPLAKEKRQILLTLCTFLEKLASYDGHFLTYAQREDERRLLRFFCMDPSARISERLALGKAAVFFSATLAPMDYYRSVLCGSRRTSKIEVPSPFESGALCVGIMDKISVRAQAREETLPEIAKVIITTMKARRGNYMVFCPSYDYMERVAEAFRTLTPKTPMAVQKRQMTSTEREAFLAHFTAKEKGYFVGFCVSGGIFSEGVDLVGDRLIGTIVVGVGLPGVSAERELIASYFGDLYGEGKEYAYLYPGLNRILQAAGRVIRKEEDRGVAVLIDDRLRDEACRRVFPPTWRNLKYVGDRPSLTALLSRFWAEVDAENANKNLHSEDS